jgi:hypothetical protein
MGLELLAPKVEARPEAWARYVHEQATSTREIARKTAAAERVKLYRDDYRRLLERMVSEVFVEPVIRQQVTRMLPLISGTSFVKRVANEMGRPIYARAPLRRVTLGDDEKPAKEAQAVYQALSKEMGLDACMDTIARLITACTAVFGFVRYVEAVGLTLDVMTPDMVTVIPHPEIPTRALAVAYVKTWHDDRPHTTVCWDDKRYLEIGPRGGLHKVTPHDFGMLPFLEVHARGRTGCYWQETLGDDLISQTRQSMFIDLILIRKTKIQSLLQLTYVGDSEAIVKKQVLDESSILHAEKGLFGVLNLESDPAKYLSVKQANEAAVAAANGISRDRLNQEVREASDDVALQERVAELAAIMAEAEARVFEIAKQVSREHPKHHVPEDARLLVDLGQIHNRVDRKTQLDVRQTERSMGLRSGVDDVLEDNPEMGGDRGQAMARIRAAMAEEAIIVEERRKLNAPADGGSPEEPGQSPQQNGAMGPKVRDGEMTRDEAADEAAEGPPPPQQK